MATKPSKNTSSLPRTRRKKGRIITKLGIRHRDKETNVYIPTDAEVAALKAWSEFCKL